jgi:hypothetical protein
MPLEKCAGDENRQGANHRNADWRRGLRIWVISLRIRTSSHNGHRDQANLKRMRHPRTGITDPARRTRCCVCGSGSANTDHTLEEVGQQFSVTVSVRSKQRRCASAESTKPVAEDVRSWISRAGVNARVAATDKLRR